MAKVIFTEGLTSDWITVEKDQGVVLFTMFFDAKERELFQEILLRVSLGNEDPSKVIMDIVKASKTK